jgi:hypothetical protein
MEWPTSRFPWPYHVGLAAVVTAGIIALWTLVGRASSRGDWLAIIGYTLEATGLYLSLAELRYNRRGIDTPLPFIAFLTFLVGAQLSLLSSLSR